MFCAIVLLQNWLVLVTTPVKTWCSTRLGRQHCCVMDQYKLVFTRLCSVHEFPIPHCCTLFMTVLSGTLLEFGGPVIV